MSRSDTFGLNGGINIAAPVSSLSPGNCWTLINWELAPLGGYRKTQGYERFDGRTAPSSAVNPATVQALRDAIEPVPGINPVRGIFVLNGIVYAFRDNADGVRKNLYRSSPSGWQLVTTPDLADGGRLDHVKFNFYGSAGTQYIYGCDGVNPPFEFDGTNYTEIVTGSEPLYPTHIAAFKNHLFLSYGGSLVNSATGNPTDYQAINGAGEIAVGDEIFAIAPLQGGRLAIYCKDQIVFLAGTSVENFQLDDFSKTGVREYSVAPLFSDAIYLDKQVQRLSTTDTFGDFQAASLSEPIRPLIEAALDSIRFVATIPEKNQYIIFTDNGVGYVATFAGGQLAGWSELRVAHNFVVGGSFEDADGLSVTYFGDDNGYVYQINKGTSFDGESIDSFLQLAPIHSGGYTVNKRFRKVSLDIDTQNFSGLFITADFDYAQAPRAFATAVASDGAGLVWNVSNWNEVVWNNALKTFTEAYIDGHGRNIAVYMYHSSAVDQTFTIELMTINYDLRKQVR